MLLLIAVRSSAAYSLPLSMPLCPTRESIGNFTYFDILPRHSLPLVFLLSLLQLAVIKSNMPVLTPSPPSPTTELTRMSVFYILDESIHHKTFALQNPWGHFHLSLRMLGSHFCWGQRQGLHSTHLWSDMLLTYGGLGIQERNQSYPKFHKYPTFHI